MADTVTLYHPALKTTATVSEGRASVMEKSGWTRDIPKKVERELEKEAK